MKTHTAVLVLFACAACAPLPREVMLRSQFDVAEASKQLQPGNNTIKGSALIRQRGGGVVSCAGSDVALLPATAYASERIVTLYGNTQKGFLPVMGSQRVKFNIDEPAYHATQKRAFCDSQGFFKFQDLSDGRYFITTSITWRVNDYSIEGGSLMLSVSVTNGELKEVVLAP